MGPNRKLPTARCNRKWSANERRRHPRGRAGEELSASDAAAERVAAGPFKQGAEIAAIGVSWSERGDFLGAEGCVAGSERGRSAGADREERRGEDHAAENTFAHHAAHGRLGGDSWAGGQFVGGGHGVPSGADGAREHVFERRDAG